MKKLLSFCTAWLLVLFVSAATVIVNASGQGDYLTVADGISNTVSGDTIYIVGSSSSYGNVTISSPRVLLGNGYYGQATGYHPSSTLGTITLSVGSSGTVLTNLQTGSIVFNDNNLTINSCLVSGPITISSALSGLSFEKCIFTSTFSNSASSIAVTNSIFNSSGSGSTVFVSGAGSITFDYCTFYDGNHSIATGTATNCVLNSTRVSQSPAMISDGVSGNAVDSEANLLFQSTFSQDQVFQFQGGSPALTASNEGAEAGAYGFPSGFSENAYVISGLPNIPKVTSLDQESSSNTSSNLSIRIQATNN